MSFFKLLSDKQEDYEVEDVPHDIDDENSIGVYTNQYNMLEIALDTGESFIVPMTWLIDTIRSEIGKSFTCQAGTLH